MDKVTHTPGPWKFDRDTFNSRKHDDKCGSIIGVDEDGRSWIIAEVCGDGPNCESDARLIAAAPEMLGALKRARGFIKNGIELGFIRMPDADTKDPAHETLPAIEQAIQLAESVENGGK